METRAKKTIIANWKNHPDSWAEAEQILDATNEYFSTTRQDLVDQVLPGIVICPPFVFLEEVGKVLKTSHFEHEASLGSQDIAVDDDTALTGEISGPMLSKLGVKYVIVGHSERRWPHCASLAEDGKLGESDEVVNKKIKAVLHNGMVPIVCVGERVRDDNFKEFLKNQIEKTFFGLSQDELGKCIIAYEPVWAISTSPDAHPDTPESAIESIGVIQDALISKFGIRNSNLFLYGGSVTSKNVADFIGQKEIDGVLVGGASINKEEFVKILKLI